MPKIFFVKCVPFMRFRSPDTKLYGGAFGRTRYGAKTQAQTADFKKIDPCFVDMDGVGFSSRLQC